MILTIAQAAGYMSAWGFPETAYRDGLAIIAAESGFNTNAVSRSGDYGLWQINTIHFGDGIIDRGNWDQPGTSTHEAAVLSGHGANWAAWCTAWADPGPNCGHGNLPHIQPGSAAYNHLDEIAPFLRTSASIPPPGGPASGIDAVTNSWAALQAYTRHGAAVQFHDLNLIRAAIQTQRPRA